MHQINCRIPIRTNSRSIVITGSSLHFSFGSGRLTYDCVRCGSQCCKGHGYLVNGQQELLYQLRTRPYARFFMEHQGEHDGIVQVKNCVPGCFFLAANGLCEVELSHGRAAKPETCRLFPFNSFKLIDGNLVVGPHLSLCPLGVMAAGETSVRSEYGTLAQEMGQAGIGSPLREHRGLVKDSNQLLSLEGQMVELSERAISQALPIPEVLDEQSRLTEQFFGPAITGGETRTLPAFATYLDTIALALGVPTSTFSEPMLDLDRVFLASMPPLRSQIVLQPVNGSGPENGVVDMHRLPGIMAGLFALTRIASMAGMTSVTFQTITKLFTDYKSLIILTALLDEILILHPTRTVTIPLGRAAARFQRDYIRIVKALVPGTQSFARRPLGSIIAEHNQREGLERVLFLRTVSDSIIGRVSPLDNRRANEVPIVRRIPTSTQHAIVRYLSEDFLMAACQRGSRARRIP